MAHIVALAATIEPPLLAALGDAARGKGSLTEAEGWRLLQVCYDRLAVLFRAAPSIIAQCQRGEELVRVDLPSGVTRAALGTVYDAANRLVGVIVGDGGLSQWLTPGWLGRLLVVVNGMSTPETWPLFVLETVAGWRTAADEMSAWRQAVSLLHTESRWTTDEPARLAALERLRRFAGIPQLPPDDGAVTDGAARNPDHYRTALTSLLVRRLEQNDAWPRPARGVPVGTLGRALWSLWPRVTGQRPPRRCAWVGCQSDLPADGHGNLRYCDVHRREAARLRAAKNRA